MDKFYNLYVKCLRKAYNNLKNHFKTNFNEFMDDILKN